MIASHPQLARPPARRGINPFTRQPMDFKPSATTAVVRVDGAVVGHIAWAEDGSEMLYVTGSGPPNAALVRVAQEVASALEGVLERHAGET